LIASHAKSGSDPADSAVTLNYLTFMPLCAIVATTSRDSDFTRFPAMLKFDRVSGTRPMKGRHHPAPIGPHP
jgi:hypothetical protein